MNKIILLSEDTINKIAAGEVIDRPSSIVKELVENSIDANATIITVDVKNGGKTLISVSDNGNGILKNDLHNVFLRHATSKIKDIKDLSKINTLGFRGEAMSSISAVSETELFTRNTKEAKGSHIMAKNGKFNEIRTIGYPIGTNVRVKNLFYNTPARKKFLKSDRTENNYITSVMEGFALSNTNISFKYISNEKTIFHTPGNGDLLSVIQCIYGLHTAKLMMPLNFSNKLLSIEGFIGKPELSKGNSTYIIFSVNNRIVKNISLKESVKTAYKSLLMNRRYPFAILNISINPETIDVNVHPTKAEIKFADERSIFSIIYYAVNQTLTKNNLLYSSSLSNGFKSEAKENILPYEPDFFGSFDIKFAENRVNSGLRTTKEIEKKEHSRPNIIIGQLFNTYILCQNDDTFFLIDQHAAHERIVYEKLLFNKKNNLMEQQSLLMPIIIQLSTREVSNIQTRINFLKAFGFDIEIFDDNSIAIRQVPIIMGQACSGSVITDLLDTIEDIEDNIDVLEEKALLQIACKSAVRAGDRLKNDEIIQLIDELFKIELFYTCPHGRPTIVTLSKYELEKKFKRKI